MMTTSKRKNNANEAAVANDATFCQATKRTPLSSGGYLRTASSKRKNNACAAAANRSIFCRVAKKTPLPSGRYRRTVLVVVIFLAGILGFYLIHNHLESFSSSLSAPSFLFYGEAISNSSSARAADLHPGAGAATSKDLLLRGGGNSGDYEQQLQRQRDAIPTDASSKEYFSGGFEEKSSLQKDKEKSEVPGAAISTPVNSRAHDANQMQWQQQEQSGREVLPVTMNQTKRPFAFIVGAAMGVHKHVNHVSTNLLHVATEIFGDENYHIIISEEGQPHKWEETTIPNEKLTVVRTEKNPFPSRIPRLTYARNQYLELVMQRYSEIQNDFSDCYMVVFDLDFSCEINLESIGKALALHEHWDAISFNIANYWDWYAFEALDHGSAAMDRRKFLEDLNSLEENELLEVTSAFHIAAIYNISHLNNTKYIYQNGECEHKGLHKMMKKEHSSRIVVSPMPLYMHGCI